MSSIFWRLLIGGALVVMVGCGDGAGTRKLFFGSGNWTIPPAFHGNFWVPGGEGQHRSYVFEPLFLYVPQTLEFVPVLGTGYELAPDRRRMTVRLRPGVRWHDGAPFSSADVRTTDLLGYIVGWPIWNRSKLDRIETPDALTVRFSWKEPITRREEIDILAYADLCYPHHLFGEWDGSIEKLLEEAGKFGDFDRVEWERRIAAMRAPVRDGLFGRRPELPVGTGPFRVKKVTADVQQLERFEGGWCADRIAFDEVRIVRVPDNRMAWAVLMAGELDVSNAATPFDVAQRVLELDPGTRMLCPSDMQEFGIVFNTRRERLSSLPFRRALAHILDREAITRVSSSTSDPVSEHSTGILRSHQDRWLDPTFLAGLTRYDHSLEKAATLLESEGFVRDEAGRWLHEGSPVELELITAPNSDWVTGCEAVAAQLSHSGIQTRVRIVPPEVARTRMSEGDFDLMAEMGADFKRYALPELSYRRFFAAGDVIAMASGISGRILAAEGVDPADMVREFDHRMTDEQYRDLVLKLARFSNEYLPFLAIYEKRLQVFSRESSRVRGWPGADEPVWSVAGSGLEAAYVEFMRRGWLVGGGP